MSVLFANFKDLHINQIKAQLSNLIQDEVQGINFW